MTAAAAPRATAVHLAERLSCVNPDEPRVGNRWPAVWSIVCRGCGAGEVSGDRVRTNLIQTMTRQSPEGA